MSTLSGSHNHRLPAQAIGTERIICCAFDDGTHFCSALYHLDARRQPPYWEVRSIASTLVNILVSAVGCSCSLHDLSVGQVAGTGKGSCS